MPPKPVVSTKTNEWRRYYICKRHLEKRKPKTDNFIRTYGTCPCFVTCRGNVHAEDSWNICVDKYGNGRCDHTQCNQFYLTGRCGFVDESDGRCYWAENLSPVRTAEGDHLALPEIAPAPPPPRIASPKSPMSRPKQTKKPSVLSPRPRQETSFGDLYSMASGMGGRR